ncbi:MAG: lysine transporter LysE [Candidatus Abyssobacteria bacterium SURF_5]|uniref:Lysine transporter LysE n=1 Tax=Abyssobacteria bacterium (strain SURF_5) TaxID=2093360 RepID=A0A3A4P0I0_ABYX5|nr:MAG: lysine transporter LysE [Candidatus Abyssubacteria bacterium SURF_5]
MAHQLLIIFLTSLGIGFTGAVMPGPLLAVTVKESISRSKWSALWLSTGHALCELALVIVLAAGLNRFVFNSSVSGFIGLVGGVILIWMGVGALRSPSYDEGAISSNNPRPPHNLILNGSAVTISNPYWSIWWFLVAPALLIWAAGEAGIAGIITFYIGHILSDFLWFGSVGFAIGSGRRFLTGRGYKLAIQVCGVFLLLFGIYFIGYGGKIIGAFLLH